jgi:hypothetical protein
MDIRSLGTSSDALKFPAGVPRESVGKEPPLPEDSSTLSAPGSTPAKSFSLLTVSSSLKGAQNSQTSDEWKPLEQQIETIESMQKLNEMVGNHAKAKELAAIVTAKKKELEQLKATPPPPPIDQSVKDEIAAYIQNKGPMPSSLDGTQKEYLDHIKSLAGNGMHFNSADWQPLAPEDAFCRLVETRVISFDNQVQYQTSVNGGLQMTTLRPAYLNPLDQFVTYSKKGYVFYDKTPNGPVAVRTASEFIEKFKDNPKGALVMTIDGSLVSPEEADKIKAQQELDGMISGIAGGAEKPTIIDEDDFVVIGGVVLQKNK